ncbi:MAG: leucine-rich repeat domain-containing protein [Ruminococcaceae bacterium]|nr:leucine-rich repeat domain-containing protein [Oscillospiraceae bacterium]
MGIKMSIKKSSISKKTEYTVSYNGMRGVDFSTIDGKTKRYRFAYLENMYKDYSGDGEGIIESIPGFRKLMGFGDKIHSIYSHKSPNGKLYVVVHAGENLYRFDAAEKDKSVTLSPLISIENTKSRGFTLGSDLYILDGKNITRIRSDGTASKINDSANPAPYIPTTYFNGTEYEQRNLLTEKFCEKYVVTVAGDMAVESDGLIYKILSKEEGTVGVAGIKSDYGGVIYIPSYTYIAGERYKVTEISAYAFYNNAKISSVTLSDTVTKIGKYAFGYCSILRKIVCRSAIERIDSCAFFSCAKLSAVHLGIGLKEIDTYIFAGCSSLTMIDYEGTENEFSQINTKTSFDSYTVNYDTSFNSLVIEIPIYSPATAIERVTLGGESVSYSSKTKDSLFTAITINSTDRTSLEGKEVEIYGYLDSTKFTANSMGTNFIGESGAQISGRDAILGCTVCECFDGRVFLSGNPALPNTVFYSSRDNTGRNNPLYFGILNYFNDGTGAFTVKSLLATGDSLAVFKSGDDGGGSIYYHTPRETGANLLPKIYPVSYIHTGIAAIGESVSFFDDPLFLSSIGLCALDKKMINLERSIAVRSENVNTKLLAEDLENVTITRWCGYLVLQAADRFYLADSRDIFTNSRGYNEYEWYYLSGIGTYEGATKVFRYAENAKEGYFVHPEKANSEVNSPVYLTMTGNAEPVYYVTEDGVNYEVYTDGEKRGGTFSPASCVFATEGDLMFFGTESGNLCVFNNDMRGVAPTHLKEQADFNEEEYKAHYGSSIHPYFYNFDWHAPRYALKTVFDDGGIPNYTKNTVKNSLVVKVRCIGNGSVCCEVGTDKNGYKEIAELPDSAMNFAEFDFENLSFANVEYATLALKERERGWLEKTLLFIRKNTLLPSESIQSFTDSISRDG